MDSLGPQQSVERLGAWEKEKHQTRVERVTIRTAIERSATELLVHTSPVAIKIGLKSFFHSTEPDETIFCAPHHHPIDLSGKYVSTVISCVSR